MSVVGSDSLWLLHLAHRIHNPPKMPKQIQNFNLRDEITEKFKIASQFKKQKKIQITAALQVGDGVDITETNS